MHVHQDSVYQNIKGWKGAPVEDSLIKWRKKCCGAVFSVLTLLFCVRAGGVRACAACSGTFSVPLPSFSGTKIYVAFFSLPIFFHFTLQLLQYQRNSPQVLRPREISPLVEVKAARPLRVWVERRLFLTSSYHGIIFPRMTKEMPEYFRLKGFQN